MPDTDPIVMPAQGSSLPARLQRFSIRTLLFLLIGLSIVAILFVLYTGFYSDLAQDLDSEKSHVLTLAQANAAGTSRLLAGTRERLQLIAQRPGIRKLDPDHCDPLLASYAKLFSNIANIHSINLHGDLICSAIGGPEAGINISATRWYKEARTSPGFVISAPMRGPISGKHISALTYPIHDDQRQITGYLFVGFDLESYEPNLSGVPLPQQSVYGIVDREGNIFWQGENKIAPGNRFSDHGSDLHRLLEIGQGTLESAPGNNKVARVYAIAPIADSDLYAFIGMPTEQLYASDSRQTQRTFLISLLSILAIGMGAAGMLHRLTRPMTSLADSATQLMAGKLDARAEVAGASETQKVALVFNRLVDSWQSAEKLKTQTLQRLRVLSQDLVHAQEQERRRLSAELHDRTSANLAALNTLLTSMYERLPPATNEALHELFEDTLAVVQDTERSVREICTDLRPQSLDHAGLVGAIESYIVQFKRRQNILVEFETSPDLPRFSHEIESSLFRILQESLTNCAKHSKATRIVVNLWLDANSLSLIIHDNGQGFVDKFDVNITEIPGMGLTTMRERAEFIGADFELDSNPIHGTKISVTLPINVDRRLAPRAD